MDTIFRLGFILQILGKSSLSGGKNYSENALMMLVAVSDIEPINIYTSLLLTACNCCNKQHALNNCTYLVSHVRRELLMGSAVMVY